MARIYVTHPISDHGINLLKEKGYEVFINSEQHVFGKEDVIEAIKGKGYDAILSLLNDKIDESVFEAAGEQCKIFANYAVGYNNIDVVAAKRHTIVITNTPGVLTNTVAEHTFALLLSIMHRVAEADRFTRAGKYEGWAPQLLLGNDASGKTLGILGSGRIGSRVAHHGAKGFDMRVIYYDVKRNEHIEQEVGAEFRETVDEVIKEADIVTIHVPLLDSTRHLINRERLLMMKPTSYLVNTSRGPVIDEHALAEALRDGVIKGAALDVFENEPKYDPIFQGLDNVILTPHIASGTEETRQAMSEMAAQNIIAALEGQEPPNIVK
ncbi:MAG: D-glycerate dehydrogenase [Candidatus Harrisonbacteria bacterium CG10_big_fil_rev_8_21_14_0_10_42_17]|uniref:D-glycerate dehydrogenase n=1 Tax=Candidatus Harrisonbacteria bacterium CG10_big_fil_rev_8_21_14_0_10_42_17 TaxID=1974584 RepID=A0A2M6WHN1_9BACT|nr:MAG: D-glycerate dehydrogenase [Candidatus Harrisonbacteria bacterium CG10_big_fil_rev_8_21_14_0_10_42_17]